MNVRWALEWDEVEEDEETRRHIRDDPQEWISRWGQDEDMHDRLLEHFSEVSRTRPQDEVF